MGASGPVLARPSLVVWPEKTILNGFYNFEITMRNNDGARPQPRLIWTHLVQCSLTLSTLPQSVATTLWLYCKRARKTNEEGVRELWGGLLDLGWRPWPEVRGVRSWGWDLIHPRPSLCGWCTARAEAKLLAVIDVPTYWISAIILAFPGDSPCPRFCPDRSLCPKAQEEKRVKIS